MIFQLGNKEFSGFYAPEGWYYSGNELVLVQYDLIGTKPRFQFGGETLEELSLSLTLRADFCNINQEIQDFETWKSKGEILPFILGNGEYIKDFILKSVGKTISQTLSDGTPVEVQVSLSLFEAVPDPDRKKASERKNARAIGDKKEQMNKIPSQAKTPEAQAHKALMDTQLKAWEVANTVSTTVQMENPTTSFDKVKKIVGEAQDCMSKAVHYISQVQGQINNATGIISSLNQSADKLTEIKGSMKEPFRLENVKALVLNLKSSLRGIDTNARVFTKDIILRKTND